MSISPIYSGHGNLHDVRFFPIEYDLSAVFNLENMPIEINRIDYCVSFHLKMQHLVVNQRNLKTQITTKPL